MAVQDQSRGPTPRLDPLFSEALQKSIHEAVEREIGALEIVIASRYGPYRIEGEGESASVAGPRGLVAFPGLRSPSERDHFLELVTRQLNLAYAAGLVAADSIRAGRSAS